ncbi:hypothetical protein DRN75_02085 [Nanoarchaeota archaeon]|nr:MAG: hypothetical protein DRN75_02085 [Nanoarchaeota archaeon]
MRILHITTKGPEEAGGVERVVREIATRQAKGDEVYVICSANKENKKYKGIKLVYVPKRKFMPRSLSGWIQTNREIAKINPDVIHLHDWSTFLQAYPIVNKYPHVITLHNSSYHIWKSTGSARSILYKVVEGLCLNLSNGLIVSVSPTLKNVIKRYYNIETEFIPNGVDITIFKPTGKKERLILQVSRLSKDKGVKEFLKCSDILKDYEFVIVGRGKLENEVSKHRAKLVKKYISNIELAKLYSKAAAFVMLSKSEGFGLAYIEALACGTPIVASHVGIAPYIIKKYKYAGVLAKDHREAARAIKELSKRKTSPQRLVSIVKREFNWDKIVREYYKLYKKVINNDKKAC